MKYGQIFPKGRRVEPAADQSVSSEDEAAEESSDEGSQADEKRRSESTSDSDNDVTTKSSDASDNSDVDLSIDGFSDEDGGSYKHRLGDTGTRSQSPSSSMTSSIELDRSNAFPDSARSDDGVGRRPLALGIQSLTSSCAVVRSLQFFSQSNTPWLTATYWPLSLQKAHPPPQDDLGAPSDTGNGRIERPTSNQGRSTSVDQGKADDDDDDVNGMSRKVSDADNDSNESLTQVGTRSDSHFTPDGELIKENIGSSVDEIDSHLRFGTSATSTPIVTRLIGEKRPSTARRAEGDHDNVVGDTIAEEEEEEYCVKSSCADYEFSSNENYFDTDNVADDGQFLVAGKLLPDETTDETTRHVTYGLCSEEFYADDELKDQSLRAMSMSRADGESNVPPLCNKLGEDLDSKQSTYIISDDDHVISHVTDAVASKHSPDSRVYFDDVDAAASGTSSSTILHPPFSYVPTYDVLHSSVEDGYSSMLHDSGYFSLSAGSDVTAAAVQMDSYDTPARIKFATVTGEKAQPLPKWIDFAPEVEANTHLSPFPEKAHASNVYGSEDSPRQVLSATASDVEDEHLLALAYERVLTLEFDINHKIDDSLTATSVDVETSVPAPRSLESLEQTPKQVTTTTTPTINATAVDITPAVRNSTTEIIDEEKAHVAYEQDNYSSGELGTNVELVEPDVDFESIISRLETLSAPLPSETNANAVTEVTISANVEVNDVTKAVKNEQLQCSDEAVDESSAHAIKSSKSNATNENIDDVTSDSERRFFFEHGVTDSENNATASKSDAIRTGSLEAPSNSEQNSEVASEPESMTASVASLSDKEFKNTASPAGNKAYSGEVIGGEKSVKSKENSEAFDLENPNEVTLYSDISNDSNRDNEEDGDDPQTILKLQKQVESGLVDLNNEVGALILMEQTFYAQQLSLLAADAGIANKTGTQREYASTSIFDVEPELSNLANFVGAIFNELPPNDLEADVKKESVEEDLPSVTTIVTSSSRDRHAVNETDLTVASSHGKTLTIQDVVSVAPRLLSSSPLPAASLILDTESSASMGSTPVHPRMYATVRGGGIADEHSVDDVVEKSEMEEREKNYGSSCDSGFMIGDDIESPRSNDVTEPDTVERDNVIATRSSVQQLAESSSVHSILSSRSSRSLPQSPATTTVEVVADEFSVEINGQLSEPAAEKRHSLVDEVGFSDEVRYDNEQLLQGVSAANVSQMCVLHHQSWTEAANPAGVDYQLAGNETDVTAFGNTESPTNAVVHKETSAEKDDQPMSRGPIEAQSFDYSAEQQQSVPGHTPNCSYEFGPTSLITTESNGINDAPHRSAFRPVRRTDHHPDDCVNSSVLQAETSARTSDVEPSSSKSTYIEDCLSRSAYYFESTFGRGRRFADAADQTFSQADRKVLSTFSHATGEPVAVTTSNNSDSCVKNFAVKLPSVLPLNANESTLHCNSRPQSSAHQKSGLAALKRTGNGNATKRSTALASASGARRRYEPIDYLAGDDVWQTEKLSIFRSVKLRPIDYNVECQPALESAALGLDNRINYVAEKITTPNDNGSLAAVIPVLNVEQRISDDDLFNENISLWRRLSNARQNYADQLRTLQDEARSNITAYRLLQLEESQERCRLTQLQLQFDLADQRRQQRILATENGYIVETLTM